jgi:hypothetical protein
MNLGAKQSLGLLLAPCFVACLLLIVSANSRRSCTVHVAWNGGGAVLCSGAHVEIFKVESDHPIVTIFKKVRIQACDDQRSNEANVTLQLTGAQATKLMLATRSPGKLFVTLYPWNGDQGCE